MNRFRVGLKFLRGIKRLKFLERSSDLTPQILCHVTFRFSKINQKRAILVSIFFNCIWVWKIAAWKGLRSKLKYLKIDFKKEHSRIEESWPLWFKNSLVIILPPALPHLSPKCVQNTSLTYTFLFCIILNWIFPNLQGWWTRSKVIAGNFF